MEQIPIYDVKQSASSTKFYKNRQQQYTIDSALFTITLNPKSGHKVPLFSTLPELPLFARKVLNNQSRMVFAPNKKFESIVFEHYQPLKFNTDPRITLLMATIAELKKSIEWNYGSYSATEKFIFEKDVMRPYSKFCTDYLFKMYNAILTNESITLYNFGNTFIPSIIQLMLLSITFPLLQRNYFFQYIKRFRPQQ